MYVPAQAPPLQVVVIAGAPPSATTVKVAAGELASALFVAVTSEPPPGALAAAFDYEWANGSLVSFAAVGVQPATVGNETCLMPEPASLAVAVTVKDAL